MSDQPAATSANPALLHRYLGTGLGFVAGASLVLTYLGVAPILPAGTVTPVIAHAPSVVALALMAVALFVLRPRVPGCAPGQSREEFWSTPETAGKVFPIWFLLEGGGLIAAVGYILAGQTSSAFAMGLAIAAYWMCGPDRFAKI